MKRAPGIDQPLFGCPREGGGGVVKVIGSGSIAGISIGVGIYMNERKICMHLAEGPQLRQADQPVASHCHGHNTRLTDLRHGAFNFCHSAFNFTRHASYVSAVHQVQ